MCGIVGKIGSIDVDVQAGLDLIRARGPDGIGVASQGSATHGHVRLAISGAVAQPYTRGTGLLSYAGECWNVSTLRDMLREQGEAIETISDTEVVAAAIHRWGIIKAARLVEGMFALAWTDADDHTFIVRDKIGKVPLYWVPTSDGAAWAVERKALGKYAGEAKPVHPGTIVDLTPGQPPQTWQYFQLVPKPGEFDDHAVSLCIEQAVRRHLEADPNTKMAVCLSGGLDSSLVAAIAVQWGIKPTCYHAVVVDGQPDRAAAREVATLLGLELVEVPSSRLPDQQEVERVIERIELGNRVAVDIAIISMRLAEAMQADGMKIVLTGDGADELFGGYGNLARRAKNDETWREARAQFYGKLARSDFPRANKAFLGYGVEPRAPLSDRFLAEIVLGMTKAQCPPGKKRLMKVAERWLPTSITQRQKETFQGALAKQLLDDRQRTYNAILKASYGAIVRG